MYYIMSTGEWQALIVGLPFLIITVHITLDNVLAGVAWLRSRSSRSSFGTVGIPTLTIRTKGHGVTATRH